MKKLVLQGVVMGMMGISAHGIEKLANAPEKIDYYKEIAVQRNTAIPVLFNKLTPQERVFIY